VLSVSKVVHCSCHGKHAPGDLQVNRTECVRDMNLELRHVVIVVFDSEDKHTTLQRRAHNDASRRVSRTTNT
jgi:hypothetical protein